MDLSLNLNEIAGAVVFYLEAKYGKNISYDNVILHYDPRKDAKFSCEVKGFRIDDSGEPKKQGKSEPSLSDKKNIDSKNDKIDLDYGKDIDIS